MTKKILGLDLGTNSIGWALVATDENGKPSKIEGMGSRIIPMQGYVSSKNGGESKDPMSDFAAGNGISKCKARTDYRGHRHLYERCKLRRERLHRVLNVLGFLPEHYAKEIDFEKHLGQFFDEKEPKLAWRKNEETVEFLLKKSFNEMVADFKAKGQDIKIPYDWTIYYLRKKALTQKIEKEELAWLLLNFNQKRGYYQLRGEEEDKTDVKEYCKLLKIVAVEKGEQDKKNDKKTWYKMTFANGWEYSATFATEPDWLNTEREFLITEELDKNGNIKVVKDKKTDTTVKEKRRITPLPSFDEINLMNKEQQDKIYKKIKARTEITISNSGKTVGAYIYETLLKNPTQKIRGKLVRTIERKYYKEELIAILKKQIELQPALFTEEKFVDCVRELYRSNEDRQNILIGKDFLHLFVNDILFYQRPLRSQKSSIGNCALESRPLKEKDGKPKLDKDGKQLWKVFKAIPKSNPYYQEFRLWQWLYNLKIYVKDDDKDVTAQFITSIEDKVNLFDFLNTRKEIEQKPLIQYLLKQKEIRGKNEAEKYRWNYVEDKKYPCNETKTMILTRLPKNVPDNFLTPETEYALWHIIYSVTDKNEFEKALISFAINKIFKNKEKSKNKEIKKQIIEFVNTHKPEKYDKKEDYQNGLKKFVEDTFDENIQTSIYFVLSFFENFKKYPPFKSEYGSFSEKAIKKLLPLMRLRKYWNFDAIDEKSKSRIAKIITGEYDETIKNRVSEKAINLTSESDYQGLPLWLAQYVVYDRHSEASSLEKWNSVQDLEKYLEEFKQHSLRNPIVEQVITETLRVVKDIWQKYGQGAKDFFKEIHVELGREMKNTAEDRAKITNQVTENENTNLRIKALLMEFANDNYFKNKEEYKNEKGETPDFYKKGANPVKPYSQSQQDILKIYEEYVLNDVSKEELNKETGLTETKDGKTKPITYKDISQKSAPTKKEVEKYKLWLEQKYCSPYTEQMIPLSKLFTPEYEIEHVIPQSRYFDDSLSNKVICEAAVNKIKDKQLGLEFIKNHHGEKVQLGNGTNNVVEISSIENYEKFVKEHYKNNNAKRRKLLMEEIPDKMIERQLNDTRYISKLVAQLLSNIVREDSGDDGVNSKNFIPGNGKITDKLKKDWGLNDVWNELVLPRFQRMNELTSTDKFTSKNNEGHIIPAIPFELSKGFQKKRIDHRHHAMDALVIACMQREHVQYLNNENAKSQKYHLQQGLARTIRNFETVQKDVFEKVGETWQIKKDAQGKQITKEIQVPKDYKKPWGTDADKVLTKSDTDFTVDAKKELEKVIVSFKQNLRVINKATNKYQKFKDGKKIEVSQKGTNCAIRKPLHKEFVFGKVDLPWVTVPKGKVNVAIRRNLDTSFNTDKIETITDTGIQKILKNYLTSKDNKPEIAFSPEGIENMNKNISQFNGGKDHKPIFKVRTFEVCSRFAVSTKGNKKDKYVETADATNLFYAVYERNDNKKRMFETVSLKEIIEHQKQQVEENIQKQNRTVIPIKRTLEYKNKDIDVTFLFYLSPSDLVYVPTEDEQENIKNIDWNNLNKEQVKRIFVVNDFSSTCYFTPNHIAQSIAPKEVDLSFDSKKNKSSGSYDTKTASFEGKQIKNVCVKLKIDRLGNIKIQ
jgi:CRISPR-associated endonuclease Csn1